MLVVKQFSFDAAHMIPNHPGKCKNLHGHTYKLEVGVYGDIRSNGMVIDFGTLKEMITPTVEKLDHAYLNDIWENPTAEIMARDIGKELAERFPTYITHFFIRLWETPTSYAEWAV